MVKSLITLYLQQFLLFFPQSSTSILDKMWKKLDLSIRNARLMIFLAISYLMLGPSFVFLVKLISFLPSGASFFFVTWARSQEFFFSIKRNFFHKIIPQSWDRVCKILKRYGAITYKKMINIGFMVAIKKLCEVISFDSINEKK